MIDEIVMLIKLMGIPNPKANVKMFNETEKLHLMRSL
jgi:hypothetical protein